MPSFVERETERCREELDNENLDKVTGGAGVPVPKPVEPTKPAASSSTERALGPNMKLPNELPDGRRD